MTDAVTQYFLYSTRDYMRCVCDYWGDDEDDCLPEVPDKSSQGAMTMMGIHAMSLFTMLAFLTQI